MPLQIIGGSGGNVVSVAPGGALTVNGGPAMVTKRFRDDFITLDPDKWDITVTGGATYTANGSLQIHMPTTLSASFNMRSRETFTGFAQLRFNVALGGVPIDERVTNVRFVSVDANGNRDGKWGWGWQFGGNGWGTQSVLTVTRDGGPSELGLGDITGGGWYTAEYAGKAVYGAPDDPVILRPGIATLLVPADNITYQVEISIVNDASVAPPAADMAFFSIVAQEFSLPPAQIYYGPVEVQQARSGFPWYVDIKPSGFAESLIATVDTATTIIAVTQTYIKQVSLQNLSIVPVYIKLGLDVSATDYSFVLKACTAPADGTGGVFADTYNGPLSVVAASGTGNKVVVVRSYL